MGIIDYDMEAGVSTARDSLIASAAALSVSGVHEGSNPWIMLSSVIAALEALVNNGGATVVSKFQRVALPVVASTDAQATPLIVQAGSIILPGSFIKVVTAEATGATKTVDIGIYSGDEDGVLDGISVAAVASVKGKATYTTGSNEHYLASSTVGALLAIEKLAGADVVGDTGTYCVEPWVSASGELISYSLGSADFAEMVAYLYLHKIDPS